MTVVGVAYCAKRSVNILLQRLHWPKQCLEIGKCSYPRIEEILPSCFHNCAAAAAATDAVSQVVLSGAYGDDTKPKTNMRLRDFTQPFLALLSF